MCQIHATANSAAVAATDQATRSRLTGVLPRTAQASAAAASGGTATSARYVRAVAVSDTNRIANTTSTIDATGTIAQAGPRRRSSTGILGAARGAATTPA